AAFPARTRSRPRLGRAALEFGAGLRRGLALAVGQAAGVLGRPPLALDLVQELTGLDRGRIERRAGALEDHPRDPEVGRDLERIRATRQADQPAVGRAEG